VPKQTTTPLLRTLLHTARTHSWITWSPTDGTNVHFSSAMRNYVKHLYSVSVIGIMHGLSTHTAVGGSTDGKIVYGLLGLDMFRVWPDP
jgi:hypothetical protein